jgi:hypothetical protein
MPQGKLAVSVETSHVRLDKVFCMQELSLWNNFIKIRDADLAGYPANPKAG